MLYITVVKIRGQKVVHPIYGYTDFGILIANMQILNVLDNYVIMLISTTNLNV